MARAVFSTVAAVGLFVGPASAADARAVGATQKDIVLTVEIVNEADSGADIASAHVEAVPSEGAPVTNIRVSPAAPVPVGQTKTFTVTFDMAGSPNDGDEFTMALRDIIDDAVDPDPATWDTSVLFKPFGLRFSLDRLG